MAKAGRKPKPTHLKLIEGNPGKRPLNKKEPKPKAGAPLAPKWLSAPAREEWDRLVPELEKTDPPLIAKVDLGAFASYCESWAIFIAASQDIKARGFLIEVEKQRFSRAGELLAEWTELVPNASVRIQRDAADKIRQFAAEFGLTPSARTRLGSKDDDGDGDEDLFD